MKAMVCEMCGSQDLVKQDGMFVCQNCGTKYSVEEAKKLLGTVKVDKTEETEKLLVLARRAREDNNSENAEKYYGLVLQEDPDNWEAAFFQVYYQSMQCKIMNISSAAYSVANNMEGSTCVYSILLKISVCVAMPADNAARYAAPAADSSSMLDRLSGAPVISDTNCMRNWSFVAPPSTHKSPTVFPQSASCSVISRI